MANWEWSISESDPYSFSLLVNGKDVANTKVLMDRGRWTCTIFSLYYKHISSDNPLEVISFVDRKIGVKASFDMNLLRRMRASSYEEVSRSTEIAINQLNILKDKVLMDGKLSGNPDMIGESMVAAGKIDELRNFLEGYLGRI